MVQLFDQLTIPYPIGGSVAAAVFGHARSTLDVDKVAAVQERHAETIAGALRGTYYVDADLIRDAIRNRACFNLIYLPAFFKVDVFALKATTYAQAAFARFTTARLADSTSTREFRFATAEDVVLHKLDWYVQGGESGERQWTDILGVLRVQAGRLDLDYMRHWGARIGVGHLLERVLREAAG